MSPPRQRSAAGATALGGGITVSYLLPVFLTGALSVQVGGELGFGSSGLGIAVSIYWGVAAMTATPFGGLVDRIGAVASMRLAAVVAAACSLGIAVTAHNWTSLAAWLALGGCALSLGQPAANRMLAQAVRPERLGIAFGVKQSAPPTATMLAGVSLPLLVTMWGWRPAFGVASAIAATVGLSAGRRNHIRRRTERGEKSPLRDRATIAILTVSFAISAGTASAVTTFFVESSTAAGLGPEAAGVALAVASVASILVRISSGAVSDRVATGHLRGCAALLLMGSVGITLLATGRPQLMAAGVFLGLAGVWGFPGVFWYALVRAYVDMPGRITGVVGSGVLLGGMIGPTLFGVVADYSSYRVAWIGGAIAVLVGAAGTLYGNHRLMASTARSAA